MKGLLRVIASHSLSLFLVSLFIPGLKIEGEFSSYLYAGAMLGIASLILGPFVKFITLPFNILTLGLLSFLTTLAALAVVNFIYEPINISAFTFNGFSFLGISIGKVDVSGFLPYVVISATIYFTNRLINWLFGE